MDVSVSITFKLLDKEILVKGESVGVCGLAELHVCPERKGIGKIVMEAIKKIDDRMIVGFAAGNVVGFYHKCGWFLWGQIADGRWAFASCQMPEGGVEIRDGW